MPRTTPATRSGPIRFSADCPELTAARRIGNQIGEHQAAIARLSEERFKLLLGLRESGWTHIRLAEGLKLTRSRVSRLLGARRSAAVRS